MFKSKLYHLCSELKIDSGKFINLKASVSDTLTDKPILLVFHGLSSDSNLNIWWDKFNWYSLQERYRIICINTIGSAFGSTGPSEFTFYNKDNILTEIFPQITIKDTINFTLLTLKEMGINSVETVLGCSLGGMQVLELYSTYPNFAKKYISTCACELNSEIKLYNYAQLSLLKEAIQSKSIETLKLAYKYTRFFFRLSCTTNSGLEIFESKLNNKMAYNTYSSKVENCLNYYIEDGSKYFDFFPFKSYQVLMKMITDFSLNIYDLNEANPKLIMIGIKDDRFTPSGNVKLLSHKLSNKNNNVSFYEFDSVFGHEAWILDGEKFYEFISQFIL